MCNRLIEFTEIPSSQKAIFAPTIKGRVLGWSRFIGGTIIKHCRRDWIDSLFEVTMFGGIVGTIVSHIGYYRIRIAEIQSCSRRKNGGEGIIRCAGDAVWRFETEHRAFVEGVWKSGGCIRQAIIEDRKLPVESAGGYQIWIEKIRAEYCCAHPKEWLE